MQQLRDILQLLNPIANITRLNKIDSIQSLKFVEDKLQVKPSQIAALLSVALILFGASFFIKLTYIFVWFFCYFFPAYFTLIALRDRNEKVYTKYLVYWVLFPLVLHTQPLIRMFFNRTIFNLLRVIWTALFLSPQIDFSNRFFQAVLKPFLENENTRAVTGQLDNLVQKGEQKFEEVKNKIKKQ